MIVSAEIDLSDLDVADLLDEAGEDACCEHYSLVPEVDLQALQENYNALLAELHDVQDQFSDYRRENQTLL